MNKPYNLVVPLAGNASRFIEDGISTPKYLLFAGDNQIIDLAMSSIDTSQCNIIFVVRQDHVCNYDVSTILQNKFGIEISIVTIPVITRGSVETVLAAENLINNDLPLIIFCSDVWFEKQFIPQNINFTNMDGLILSFKSNNPAHSYVQTKNGTVIKTAEKEVISDTASVGLYVFKSGNLFVTYAKNMITEQRTQKGEFYVCPLYNEYIKDGYTITHQLVDKIYVFGTPLELDFYNKIITKFKQLNKKYLLFSDHSGFEIKEKAKIYLLEKNIEIVDLGCFSKKDCDYSDILLTYLKLSTIDASTFLIGFCSTGQGVNILLNKIKGIRSALVYNEYSAIYSIRHNAANAFAIPAKDTSDDLLYEILNIINKETFDGGRHQKRVMDIVGYES
jgi:RpiB/LacA/LacB family sugar-phosphate isomerase